MAGSWAGALRSAGAALLAGQVPWELHQRREHHTRVAARRLHRHAQTELARLSDQARARQERLRITGENLPSGLAGSIFGPDLIGDFYGVVIAELQTWANEAAGELEQLHGRRLAARRTALRNLRAEIRVVCAEIEEHQAKWAGEGAVVALERASFSAGLWHLERDAPTAPPA